MRASSIAPRASFCVCFPDSWEKISSLIVDADGERMTPTHAAKRSKRYRYYVSASLLAGDRPATQRGMRVPAGDVEGLVGDAATATQAQIIHWARPIARH